jgi:hypothetical protein
MKLFPLGFSKEIQELDSGGDKFVRAREDGIFTKIDSIFINLQTLFGS